MVDKGIELGNRLIEVKASPRAYLRSRRRDAAGLIFLFAVAALAIRFLRVAQDQAGAAGIAAFVLVTCLVFGVVLAVIFRRAVVEVHERGIIVSGGFNRRAFQLEDIERVVLLITRFGSAQRRELRVVDHRGRTVHKIMADLFEKSELKSALSHLGAPVEGEWDP